MSRPVSVRACTLALVLLAAVPAIAVAQVPDTIVLPAVAVRAPDPARAAWARESLRETSAPATAQAPALAPAPETPPAGPATNDTIRSITVGRDGERTIVHVRANGSANATVSEPLHVDGRTRLILTLRDATLTTALNEPRIAGSGLARVHAEQRDTTVRVYVEAETIGAYGLDSESGGFALWIGPAVARPLVLPVARATAGSEPGDASRLPVREMVQDPLLDVDLSAGRTGEPRDAPAVPASGFRKTLGSAARTAMEWSAAAGTRVRPIAAAAMDRATRIGDLLLDALSTPGAPRWSVIGAALLLFLPIVAWKLSTNRTTAAQPVVAAPNPGADPRIWAARTLAEQGMEPAAISERTGLARDAAILIVRSVRTAKAAAPGTNFRADAR